MFLITPPLTVPLEQSLVLIADKNIAVADQQMISLGAVITDFVGKIARGIACCGAAQRKDICESVYIIIAADSKYISA